MTITRKTKIIIVGLIVLVMFTVLDMFYTKRKGNIEFVKFHNSKIHGIIEKKVTASVSGTYFQVSGEQYNFHPYTAEINSSKIFSYIADVGDSILKDKKADTLILIKKGNRYKYTFMKLVD